MPSQPDSNFPEGEQRTGLQPTDLPAAAQTDRPGKTFWKTFLKKMAITARLMGKEIHQKKLKWFDLRRADYQLGKKAYETQSAMSEPNPAIDRIKKIQIQIEALGGPGTSAPPSQQKFKGVAKGAGKFMKIQILNWRRNRALRELGHQICQGSDVHSELAPEIDNSKNVADAIGSVNSDIRGLAASTCVWARKPLLTVSIISALIATYAGISCEKRAATQAAKGSNAAVPTATTAAESASATKAVPLSAEHRSADSLAVERYLRSRLIGGVTEGQMIELSDAIAEEFSAAFFSGEERRNCFSGDGDQRTLQLYHIKYYTEGELSSSTTKHEAAVLVDKIKNMLPPRSLFWELFEAGPSQTDRNRIKSLPPVEGHIGLGERPFGDLVSEQLQSLRTAIEGELADTRMSERAIGQVSGLEEKDVLVCSYEGSNDRQWHELFWYKKNPDGLDRLLESLSPDHPVHQIGPARDAAPPTLALALKANPKSAEDLRRRINNADTSDRDAKLIRLLDQVLNY